MLFLIILFHNFHVFLEVTLIFVDKSSKSWFKPSQPAGGVARCSTYLFPMRSPGSHPPFRGFPLYGERPFDRRLPTERRDVRAWCSGPTLIVVSAVTDFFILRMKRLCNTMVIARCSASYQCAIKRGTQGQRITDLPAQVSAAMCQVFNLTPLKAHWYQLPGGISSRVSLRAQRSNLTCL